MGDNRAVIIDNGSGRIKAGITGEDVPKLIFDNHITRVVNRNGNDVLTYSYPIRNGMVQEWETMEKIWGYTYKQLNVDSQDFPALLTEAPLNSIQNRSKMAEIFFEKFQVPGLFVETQAILSLYAAGRITGLVLDSGHGVTHTVPIYEGFAFNHAIARIDVSGNDVNSYLAKILTESTGINLTRTIDAKIVDTIKRKYCYVAEDFQQELKNDDLEYVDYELPDGQTLELGPEMFSAPELLFRPALNEIDGIGVHEMLLNSIGKCSLDARNALTENLILSGGTTMIQGLEKRLTKELVHALPVAAKVKVVAPSDRDVSVWIGGSIVTGFSVFQDEMMTWKFDWEEHGASIFERQRRMLAL